MVNLSLLIIGVVNVYLYTTPLENPLNLIGALSCLGILAFRVLYID